MSTNWGYVCTTHDPIIESEHWYNHGDDLLTIVYSVERAGQWPNDPVFTAWAEPIPVPEGGEYATNSPIHWLRAHPKCKVELINEYGDRRHIPQWKPGGIRNNFLSRIETLHHLIGVLDSVAPDAVAKHAEV